MKRRIDELLPDHQQHRVHQTEMRGTKTMTAVGENISKLMNRKLVQTNLGIQFRIFSGKDVYK